MNEIDELLLSAERREREATIRGLQGDNEALRESCKFLWSQSIYHAKLSHSYKKWVIILWIVAVSEFLYILFCK